MDLRSGARRGRIFSRPIKPGQGKYRKRFDVYNRSNAAKIENRTSNEPQIIVLVLQNKTPRFSITLAFLFLIFVCACDRSETLHSEEIDGASNQRAQDLDRGKDSGPDLADLKSDILPGEILSNALALYKVRLAFSGANASDALPSKNTLPFLSASYRKGDPTLRHLNLDLKVENDRLWIERSSAPGLDGEGVRVSGSLVAFDPSRIGVQCSTFHTANVDTSVMIPQVDPSRAFINLWYKINTGTNNKNVAFVSAHFKTPTEILFERHGPDGILDGHFCVSRAVNQSFIVQHLRSEMNAGETMISIPIEAIDPSASLLLLSHQATRLQSSPGYSQIACELRSTDIRCHRGLGENEITDIHLQVIQFSGRTRVTHHRVEIADGEAQTRLVDPEISTLDSVIFGPRGMLGEVATDGDSKKKVPGSFVEAIVEDTSIVFRRGDPELGNILLFPQVVKW